MSLNRSSLILLYLCPNYRYLSACAVRSYKELSVMLLRKHPPSNLHSYSSIFSVNPKVFYSFDSKSNNKTPSKEGPDSVKPKKPKKEIKTYITLINTDQSISVSTVENASKLASRRNYKLVKVMDRDPKTDRALYQLVTESQYLKDKGWEDIKITNEKSVTQYKILSMSSKISEHDVLTKVNMMKKWLTKKHEVRVVITGDLPAAENIYNIIEKAIGGDGRILQKRVKGSDIRFQIISQKNTEKSSEVSGKKT